MSDSNETLEPQPELPLDKDNIVDMIGLMDEVQTSRQICEKITEIQRGISTDGCGGLMDAATALVNSTELRARLLSSDDLLEFDALLRKASDMLSVITMQSDLQQKVWKIVNDSIGKANP